MEGAIVRAQQGDTFGQLLNVLDRDGLDRRVQSSDEVAHGVVLVAQLLQGGQQALQQRIQPTERCPDGSEFRAGRVQLPSLLGHVGQQRLGLRVVGDIDAELGGDGRAVLQGGGDPLDLGDRVVEPRQRFTKQGQEGVEIGLVDRLREVFEGGRDGLQQAEQEFELFGGHREAEGRVHRFERRQDLRRAADQARVGVLALLGELAQPLRELRHAAGQLLAAL